jgi:iron complex outermembrane recepter protein
MNICATSRLVRSVLMLGGSLLSTVAYAQAPATQENPGATPSGAPNADIIVTAQRRSESLQKVPMTVSVATGEQLEKLVLTDFKDVQQLTPGLEMNNNDGRRNVATIRGITYEPDTSVAPAVDIYFNNIPVDAQTVFGAIYDVAQIEVLRGPQGIFRGRTSPAGAITLSTRRANLDQAEGYIQATGTNRDAINAQGGASIPLIPGKLALRVAGLADFNRGGQVRTVDGRESSLTTMSGRISLAFQPTERFRANLMYQYYWSDLTPFRAVFGPGNAPFAAFGDPTLTGPALSVDDRRSVSRTPTRFTNRTHLLTAATEFDLTDDITWSTDVGYQYTRQTQLYPQLEVEASVPGLVQSANLLNRPKTLTIDTRVSSSYDGPFNWMLGAYYDRFNFHSLFGQDSDFLLGSDAAPFPLSPDLFGSGLPNPVPATTFLDLPGRKRTQAIFGSVRYNLTDALRFEAGLRYTRYKTYQQSFLTFCIPLFGPCSVVNQPAFSPDLENDVNKALTGGATLSYDWNPNLTTYLSYGRSYRPPNAQNAAALGGTTNPDLLVSREETSDAFEVGVKGNLFDRRLSFALTGFYQKYKDFADYLPGLNTRAATGGITAITTTSNGDAVSKGIEMQLTGRPSRNIDLGVSGSYVDAHYDDAVMPCNVFDATGAAVIPVGQEFAICTRNDRLAQVPKFSAAMNGEVRFPVGELTPFIRGLANYRPGFTSDFDNFTYRAYTNVSLFVGIRGAEDRWELTAFVKNLLDQARAIRVGDQQLQKATVQFDFATPAAAILSGYRSAVITPPREFGVTARFKW